MMANVAMMARARNSYVRAFDDEPEFFSYAPGRVNLIGEHTDYNDGFVLPMGIGFGTVIAAGRSSLNEIAAIAVDFDEGRDRFLLNSRPSRREDLPWTHHVRGVADIFLQHGYGLKGGNFAISGDIPRGAGLSSSASLGVSLGLAFAKLADVDQLDLTTLALIAQESETEFVGTACGIMDQLVSARAEAGSALLIDCRSLQTRAVSMPDDLVVSIIHSGVERELADSKYNERRTQCETVSRYFEKPALRDLTLEQLQYEKPNIDGVAYRRTRHVVTENARTLDAVDALQDGNLRQLGHLMNQSHMSMRDDFEITVPKVDELVDIAQQAIGDYGGARMTGGGFGGCVVAAVHKDRIDTVKKTILENYQTPDGKAPQFIDAVPSRGARLLSD